MQYQIMNKNQLANCDSVETHHDGNNSLNSFQDRYILNSSSCEKVDQATLTDQMMCNCECDTIPKLKEKAHKSFMQVIQIQTLYKQQIQELKSFYEESLRNKDRKFQIKEDVLNEKCRELQLEIEKLKENHRRQRPYEIETSLQSPFQSDSIDNILVEPLPDDSNQSICNIREFVQTPNLKDSASRLESDIVRLMSEMKNGKNRETPDDAASRPNESKKIDGTLVGRLEQQIRKIFEFVRKLIETTVHAHQKYNDLVAISNEAEHRYTKLSLVFEANQKEAKFMAEHIKKITQDKIKLEKKCNDQDRLNKNNEESIKTLRKIILDRGINLPSEKSRRDSQGYASFTMQDEQDGSMSKNSLLLSSYLKKSAILPKSNDNEIGEKKFLACLNFKKKSILVADKPDDRARNGV